MSSFQQSKENPKTVGTEGQPADRKTWSTPRVLSSETFTKAALACCQGEIDGVPAQIGSTGSNLEICP